MDAARVDQTTHSLIETVERHIKQTHTHAFGIGFEAGYRRALCHFGMALEDMKKAEEYKGGDNPYQLAVFQLCTRHEEMVDLVNNTPIRQIIGGKEGAWKFDEKQENAAAEGLASLFR